MVLGVDCVWIVTGIITIPVIASEIKGVIRRESCILAWLGYTFTHLCFSAISKPPCFFIPSPWPSHGPTIIGLVSISRVLYQSISIQIELYCRLHHHLEDQPKLDSWVEQHFQQVTDNPVCPSSVLLLQTEYNVWMSCLKCRTFKTTVVTYTWQMGHISRRYWLSWVRWKSL